MEDAERLAEETSIEFRKNKEKEKKLEHELAKAKSILENAKNKDGLSDRLITLENDLHKARDEKDELFRNFGRLDGEINSLVKMVRKQEEVARSMEHKTVTLVSVEELSVKIEEKIKTAKVTNDAGDEDNMRYIRDYINHHFLKQVAGSGFERKYVILLLAKIRYRIGKEINDNFIK
jgi:CRISPR/Cas system CSM-associated protein Csm2 small subunit